MRWAALGLALAAVSACRDAPTAPAALQQWAGGEEWVAVRVPDEVPTLRTWLPYVRPATARQRVALEQVRTLQLQAEAARRAGDPDRASEYAREAVRAAVVSMTHTPDGRVVRESLAAVGRWVDRVEREVDLERYPTLRASAGRVERDFRLATESLATGDTLATVLHLASAAETIHRHSPSAVALRVLARVEERLRHEQDGGADHERALHLLSSAREELLRGDESRALRRALYALQLADGKGVHSVAPADSGAVCVALPCGE